MELHEALSTHVNAMVDSRLKALGANEELLKGLGGKPDPEAIFRLTDKVWRNNGWLDPEERYKYPEGTERDRHRIGYDKLIAMVDQHAKKLAGQGMQDAIETTSAVSLIPKVITRVVREAVEPLIVLTGLMRRINFSAGETISFPAVGGGMWAADIPPGGEYPEQSMEFAGWVQAKIGKSGLAVRITEEMIRYAMYDVMTMHLQAGGRALVRHKEKKCANLLQSQGRTAFDNSGGTSRHGYTSGRNVGLLFNKTITLDDLFVMYADLLNAGFIPDSLITNPMGWLIFARDGTMRQFSMANNGMLWQTAQGQRGLGPNMPSPNLGPSVGQDPDALNPQASLYTPPPSIFPVPLKMIVSPFIYFNQSTRVCNVGMADSMELGVIVVDEDVVTDQWDDPRRDIRSAKLRERYGLAIDNLGQAIMWAKNVRIDRNYDWEANIGLGFDVGSTPLPSGFQAGV